MLNENYAIGTFPGSSQTEYLVGNYLPESAVDIANGVSNDLPGKISRKQSIAKIKEYLLFKVSDKDIFVSFPNTALYSPVSYLPQSAGILVGRIFKFSDLISFYLGRLFNLTSYILIIFYSIRITPVLKKLLLTLALMPMSLFLAASNSPDAILISIAFLVFATTINLYINNTDKNILILFATGSILIGLIKPAYILLPLALTPWIFIKNTKFRILFLALISIVSFSLALLWTKYSSTLFLPLISGVDPVNQVRYIFQNPIYFLHIIKNTLIGHRNYLGTQFVGNLGWLDTPLPFAIVLIYLFVLLLSTCGEKISINIKSKISSFMIGTVSAILVIISIYLSWTPVAKPVVDGLVGRYFIPVAPYILLITSNNFTKYKIFVDIFIFTVIFTTSILAFAILIHRYYIVP